MPLPSIDYQLRTAYPQPHEYQMIKLEEIVVGQPGIILCPACGEGHGCMEDGDEIYAIGPDRDEYESPMHTRGGWLETRGVCSGCGTGYSLVLANHKGSLAIGIAPIKFEGWSEEDRYEDEDE